MALIGVVYRFSGVGSWSDYHEGLEQFFEINQIHTESKKKALLLNAIETYVYEVLRGLCHPTMPKDKTYEELIVIMNNHYISRKSVFRERIKFYQAVQTVYDSISDWLACIRELAVDCKFGVNSDAVLRDRFVSGLRSTTIRERLYEENEDVTLEKCLEIAKCMESSLVIKKTVKKNVNDDVEMCPCCVGCPPSYGFLMNK